MDGVPAQSRGSEARQPVEQASGRLRRSCHAGEQIDGNFERTMWTSAPMVKWKRQLSPGPLAVPAA